MKAAKKKRRAADHLRVLPPAPAPIDELEQARALEEESPEDQLRRRQRLIDRQRGERSEMAARHTREVADLVVRQAREERELEHRHQIEFGRLQGENVGPWLQHQAKRGPRT